MNKIRELIKTKEDYYKLIEILLKRAKKNKPISENGMIDGIIIGWMISTETFVIDLFLDRDMGRVLDGTMQKLEQIAVWVVSVEDKLCSIYEDKE
jgi:hypothetical protein